MPGTLALVGSGEYLPPMEPVDRLLLSRLNGGARVVCLATAAGAEGPERIKYWSDLGVRHFIRLGAPAEAVPVVNRATANDHVLAGRIRNANFVYLSGGKPGYLYETLNGSAAWRAIQDVYDGGGVVAGCSAGAMVFGERILGFPMPWPTHPGFNYLPGALVMPHFDEIPEHYVQVVKGMAGTHSTLLGIDGNTALVHESTGSTVAGSGRVLVWSPERKTAFRNGERVIWP